MSTPPRLTGESRVAERESVLRGPTRQPNKFERAVRMKSESSSNENLTSETDGAKMPMPPRLSDENREVEESR